MQLWFLAFREVGKQDNKQTTLEHPSYQKYTVEDCYQGFYFPVSQWRVYLGSLHCNSIYQTQQRNLPDHLIREGRYLEFFR